MLPFDVKYIMNGQTWLVSGIDKVHTFPQNRTTKSSKTKWLQIKLKNNIQINFCF